MTFLHVRKGLDSTDQHRIKGVLTAVGMHFILMRVQQFKPLKDSHVNWSSYSVVGNIFPLWSLKGYWLETILSVLQCFQRGGTPAGMNELSQQPSTDFGCGALQMQKRRFLVLIFSGWEQYVVPNELSHTQLKEARSPSQTGDNVALFPAATPYRI